MSKKVLALVFLTTFAASCSMLKKENAALKAEIEKGDIHKKGQIVFFDFNSAELTSDAKNIIDDRILPVLKSESNSQVKVEGHCDERGSTSYNNALGKRRANSVKAYLVEHDIKSSRIRTVSYGESRPLDYGHNEEAWAKNRRAVTISATR